MVMNSNQKELTRGDTGLFSITLYDGEGDEYIPDENDTLTFYLLKKNCDDLTDALVTKTIPTDTMELELLPSDTRDLSVGSYPYRIRIADTVGHEYTVVKSTLKIVC